MGNLSTSTSGAVLWNPVRQGMEVPNVGGPARAVSQFTTNGLLAQLSTEFSIEIFLSSRSNPLISRLLIAGFGDWPAGAPFAPCDSSNSVSEGGWRLSSGLGNVIFFEVVMLANGAPVCMSIPFSITPNTLKHLVFRARGGVVSVVSHGGVTQIVSGNPTFSPLLWARHYAPLTIASPHVTTGWTGSMYMIAMYDRYLSNEEIAANRAFGPPNSFPYGTGAVLVDEDTPVTLVSAV
jgi:hypothetical protein